MFVINFLYYIYLCYLCFKINTFLSNCIGFIDSWVVIIAFLGSFCLGLFGHFADVHGFRIKMSFLSFTFVLTIAFSSSHLRPILMCSFSWNWFFNDFLCNFESFFCPFFVFGLGCGRFVWLLSCFYVIAKRFW